MYSQIMVRQIMVCQNVLSDSGFRASYRARWWKKNETTLSLLARRTQQLRTGAGLSQDKFARLVGRHRSLISAVEGGRKNLSLDTVDLIASALGVEVVSLFGEDIVLRDPENAEPLRARVARTIKTLRDKRKLSQEDLSESAELWRGYVAYLERRKPNADLVHLARLADALAVPIGALFASPGSDEKASNP
ncbi:helix-turn-helix domain-containing protein (plasmid) [Burkholderia ambifaria]|uniref:helix-turn-helix transcriptional regulator n=1 Tax=Burkholderia ambifaria TaxID=152480 RepID=UPI0018F72D17|nr:helix-turn-helix transcriptional regulator [Burkholderia ambifaria]QQK01070.1 helix-turn-helix domain-containing protein [Burkholderia ambifaria]